MSIIDYGAIAFKNGRLISTDMFTPMEETCGFSDRDNYLPKMDFSFDGNMFVTVGNRDIVIGFYKEQIHWWAYCGDKVSDEYKYNIGYEYFNCSNYTGWKKWHKIVVAEDIIVIDVKRKNGYYKAKFDINGDKYMVYFGYGVDFGFYERTHFVNYYRSLEYFAKKVCRSISRMFRRK